MLFSKPIALVAVAFLAAAGESHMMMRTPTPYGKSSLNNSPLDGTGADFPCKQRPGVYDAEGASNVAAIGEAQTLSFIGGATHGGGSCQVSLTSDTKPTKDSKWMVIKSIIGGCPSDAEGNLSGDPAGTGASTFQYTIPAGIAPGDYTIAWTWFNHIGNREMYMNCGPMTVTAAKKKRYAVAPKVSKRQSTFPNMFVANIDGTCHTPDSVDLVFADPGTDVQTAGKGPYATATCNTGKSGGAAAQPTGAASPASGGLGATTTAAPAISATGFAGGNSGQYSQAPGGQYSAGNVSPGSFGSGASVTTPASAPSSSADDNQVIPVTTSAGQTFAPAATPVSPSQTMSAPKYTNSSAPQIAPSNAAASGTALVAPVGTGSAGAGSAGTSAGQLSGPCSNEGGWNCIDGSSFQRCASGAWSAAIPMSGMKCTPGETANFVMTPAKAKRFES